MPNKNSLFYRILLKMFFIKPEQATVLSLELVESHHDCLRPNDVQQQQKQNRFRCWHARYWHNLDNSFSRRGHFNTQLKFKKSGADLESFQPFFSYRVANIAAIGHTAPRACVTLAALTSQSVVWLSDNDAFRRDFPVYRRDRPVPGAAVRTAGNAELFLGLHGYVDVDPRLHARALVPRGGTAGIPVRSAEIHRWDC